MILAGIDIGTNTLRLLVAEIGRGSFRELYADRRITRLGQGLDHSGMIDPAAGERSVKILLDFAAGIRRYGARHIDAIGTSALRNASNTPEFLTTVKEKTGLDIRVISGEEEARLSLLGVGYSLKAAGIARSSSHGPSCVVDIGGGSTEVIISPGAGASVIASLPLGAVYLTERFLKHDPPSPDELDRLRAAVRDELDSRAGQLGSATSGLFIGTAGTITTYSDAGRNRRYDPRHEQTEAGRTKDRARA